MGAIRAGITAFREQNFVPLEQAEWDTPQARIGSRYPLYQSYYDNVAYSSINVQSRTLKEKYKLYKNIRGIYNPVARQNQLIVSHIYGGSIDVEHMTGGAIPIVTDNEAILDALRLIFKWSRFGEQKSLYVRWGALLGDVFLKVVDDRAKEKVMAEVIHPNHVYDATFDSVGNITAAIIQYTRNVEPDLDNARPSGLYGFDIPTFKAKSSYLYTEKITKDKFETFRDGKPFAYYLDSAGKPVSEWDNEFGFVPLVMANHFNLGLKFGGNAYYNSLRKVDEVNHEASLLNDQIQKIIIPLLFASGVRDKKQIDVAAEKEDQYSIIYSPSKDAKLEAIVGQIDLEGALKNIQEMNRELERDMPELAFQSMRERNGDFTAPGIRAGYSDAIGRIVDARGNYDHALVRALQMAISIGGHNGYEGFESFSLDSYDRGDLDMYIKDRPVIADSLGLGEKLDKLSQVGSMQPSLQRLALKAMDYDEKTIEEVIADSEKQTRNAARGVADAIFNNEPDEDDFDEEDVAEDQEADEETA